MPLGTVLGRLKKLSTIAGGLTALVPGFAYFADRAPPYFEASALLTSGVAMGVLVLVHSRSKYAARKDYGRAVAVMVAAVALMVFYSIGSQYWVVGPPRESDPNDAPVRIQTGFHMASWSLTPEAQRYVEQNPKATPQHLMLAVGAFGPGFPVDLVWTTWSIVTAGLLLSLLYAGSFILWTYGFALLGRPVRAR